MKKLLLGTSALIGAVAFAGAALAEAPKVTVGGTSDFQVGIASDDRDANQRGHAFRSDNEISFKVDGKTDGGLGYGGEIVLEADVTNDADTQGTNAAKTYVYLDGSWGRVEMGSTIAPTNTMKVDASSIAAATGGIDGDWTYFANSGAGFIATPDLVLDYGAGNLGDESTENANKIVYYSPRFSGFQLGLAYTPSHDSRGQTVTRANNNVGQSEQIISGGINYEGKWDQVSLAASLTGETGDAELTGTQDLTAYAAGAKLGYMGFSLAGSYGTWDDSNQAAANLDNNDFWTVGLGYEHGPIGVSATYIKSELAQTATTENKFDNLVVGADYKLAPGLTPYAEVSFYDQDAVGTVNDNDGTVVLLGTQLNF